MKRPENKWKCRLFQKRDVFIEKLKKNQKGSRILLNNGKVSKVNKPSEIIYPEYYGWEHRKSGKAEKIFPAKLIPYSFMMILRFTEKWFHHKTYWEKSYASFQKSHEIYVFGGILPSAKQFEIDFWSNVLKKRAFRP